MVSLHTYGDGQDLRVCVCDDDYWGVLYLAPQLRGHMAPKILLKQWCQRTSVTSSTTGGVHHRLSSAYYPQSNGRAETAMTTARRIIADCTGRGGSVDTDAVAKAILLYRNTPLANINKSPAQLLFGRVLRDHLPTHPHLLHLHLDWLHSAEEREAAFTKRNMQLVTRYNTASRKLHTLRLGDHVAVQNQGTNCPQRLDRTGTVVELQPHRQCTVRLDGSGRVTIRNRRFLRPISATQPSQATRNEPTTRASV